LNHDWDSCPNDKWYKHTFQVINKRNPSKKDLNKQKNQHNLKLTQGEYVVKAIISQRVTRGKIQYLVSWEGYEEQT